MIPHEGRSIGSNDTNTDGLPAVRAPRINPACVATDRVEGRPHTTLLAFQAGPSASSGCVSTPALWGMSPSFDGDPRPGSLLRGRPSCLRNGPRLPALIRCWAANNPARHGDDRRRVGIWMLPTFIPDTPVLPRDADAGRGRPRHKTRPPAQYSN